MLPCGSQIRAFAKQKSTKKLRRQNEPQKDLTSQLNRGSNADYSGMEDRSSPGIDDFQDSNKESSFEKFDSRSSIYIPSRSAVLQACTVTSSLIAALGVIIRQVCLSFCIVRNFKHVSCQGQSSLLFQL